METAKIHTEAFFEPRPGVCLFEQWWEPSGSKKATVIIVHGLAEHSSRYAHVAEFLSRQGYAVGTYDLEGHGKSDGKRAFINTFDSLLADLQFFIKRAESKWKSQHIFLLGHSMGSGIVAKYLIDRAKNKITGAILSGSLIMAGESIPQILVKIVNVLGMVAPNMPVLQLESSTVSRDPAVVKQYETDPLNFRGKVPARTGAELNRTLDYLQNKLQRIEVPLLIMQGSEDRLVNPAGSQLLYQRTASQDKTLKIYEGLYHEILNEPEKDQVMADMVAWMDARLTSTAV